MSPKSGKSDDARLNNGFNSFESPEVVVIQEIIDGDDESQALLPSIKDQISADSRKPKRKVQWVDKNGDKLAEIVEFVPSDESDGDSEDSDACSCRIM